MVNSVDPDDNACFEPSPLDLLFSKVFVWVCRAERDKTEKEASWFNPA